MLGQNYLGDASRKMPSLGLGIFTGNHPPDGFAFGKMVDAEGFEPTTR